MQIGGVQINILHFALLTESPNELQVNRGVKVSEDLGMEVNFQKTEIKHTGRAHMDFNIVLKNQKLKQTVNFVYVGGNSVQRKVLFQMSRGVYG